MKRRLILGMIFGIINGAVLWVQAAQETINEPITISSVLEKSSAHVWGIVVVRNLHEASCWLDGYCRTLGIDPLKLERAWIRKLGLESTLATDQPTALVVFEPTAETPQPFALGFSVQDRSSLSVLLNAHSTQSSGMMEGSSQELDNCFWVQNGSHVLLSPSSVVLNRLIHLSNDPFDDMIKAIEQKKYDVFLFLDRAVYRYWTQQGGNKIIPTTSKPQDFSRADHNSIQSIALGLRLNSKGIQVVMDIEVSPNTIHHWQMLTPEAYEAILATLPKAISEILFQKPMPNLSNVLRMSPLQVCSNGKNTMRVSTIFPIQAMAVTDDEPISSGTLHEFHRDSHMKNVQEPSWYWIWQVLMGIGALTLGAGILYRLIIVRNSHVYKELNHD